MWLLVGLGNPGKKYQGNRHNAGFMVADELHKRFANEAYRDKFGGQVAGGMIKLEKILLLKPMEFMNVSGFAVQRAAQEVTHGERDQGDRGYYDEDPQASAGDVDGERS